MSTPTVSDAFLATVANVGELNAAAAGYASALLEVYGRALESGTAESGANWYASARQLCTTLANEYGFAPDRVIAAVAVCSPRTTWARQEKYLAPFLAAVKAGKEGADLPALGGFISNRTKARAALLGAPLAEVVKGEKVTAFYLNISGANTELPTLDCHAVSAAYGRNLTNDEVGRALGQKQNLADLRAAYVAAARAAGLAAADFQAIVWAQWRIETGIAARYDA